MTTITAAEIIALRKALPAILTWLRARETTQRTVGFQPASTK